MGFFTIAAIIVAVAAIALQIWPAVFPKKLQYEFGGKVQPGFETIEKIFKQNYADGWDFEGSAFAVCHNGKMVVDLWGGYADSSSSREWKEDTMSTIFSTTKAISALCLSMLVDRDLIKYTDLVTKYWPEFGQNGKEQVTIKMLASHEAGVAVLDEPITYELVRDWRKMSSALEKQKPNWEIGTGAGYHTFTFGWIIDQLLRRVDPEKRSLGQFFREEIAEPYELDLYIGLPLELEHRVARMRFPNMLSMIVSTILSHITDPQFLYQLYTYFMQSSDSLFNRAFTNPDWLALDTFRFNNPDLHALEIGGANGIGTARSLAKLFCLVDSGKIINKTLVNHLLKPVITATADHVIKMNLTWGWGFMHTTNPDGQLCIGHPGYGGQHVTYDPHYHLSIGYIKNGIVLDMAEDNRTYTHFQNALYDIIRNK